MLAGQRRDSALSIPILAKNKKIDNVMSTTIITHIVNMVFEGGCFMERNIDVTSARRQLGTLLDEVFHKGDIVTIERKGKPLAKIVPLRDTNDQDTQHSLISSRQRVLLEELNSLPAIGIDKDPVNILRSMRKQKRIQASLKYGK
jgi:prevent-host-death family protein